VYLANVLEERQIVVGTEMRDLEIRYHYGAVLVHISVGWKPLPRFAGMLVV